MPQKLNKAGKMQDYIPKGNGDASGEYGTSNGTNKNFTASDKKKETKANVITENKSVVVENEKAKKERIRKEANKKIQELHNISNRIIEKPTKEDKELFDKKMDEYEKWEKENSEKTIDYREYFKDKIEGKYAKKSNKANVIDDDLSGKKEESFEDFYNSTYYTKDGNFYKKSGRDGSVKKISQKDYELAKNMNDDLNKLGKEASDRRTEKIQKDTMERVLNKQFIPFESVGSDIRDEFKKQVVNDFYKLHKVKNHTYTDEEVKKVVESYNAWYSGSFSKQDISKLTIELNKAVK